MKNNYELCIFDFDGTLADTGPGLVYAIQQFAKSKGLAHYSDKQILNSLGKGIDNLIFTLFPLKQLSDHQKHQYIQEFIEIYTAHQLNNLVLFPEVRETLNQLIASNYKIAIVSNKPEEMLLEEARYLGINELPWINIAGVDTYVECKPSGLPLEEIMKLANVDPSKTVMIGDSDADCLSARNANCDFIGCSFGLGSQYLIENYPSETLIDEFHQLKELL